MRTIDVKDKVAELGVVLPPMDEFWRLGDLTALRQDEHGRFYRANYERGILLYALVAKYKPQSVLEFGTGRGYGCLCMAWTMVDHNIPGFIYTIDMTPPDEQFEWAIDWGSGPRVERLARNQVWPKAAPRTWLERIHVLTGFSGEVMRRWHGPPIELAFIDGGHSYDVVRHDFYSVLEVAAEHFGILFDDYAPIPGYGVQRLVDEEVAPYFEAELIYTDRRWPGGERAALQEPEYGMVWIHSERPRQPLDLYAPDALAKFLKDYRRRECWARLRRRAGRVYRWLRFYGLR
jgi:hypothetical protein